ncbi:MAG: hypothetical protein LJE84_05095 [Gammaproteobacteria bacterium]|nr:hypothetical protein [Gammaproteobacteria bacterium]
MIKSITLRFCCVFALTLAVGIGTASAGDRERAAHDAGAAMGLARYQASASARLDLAQDAIRAGQAAVQELERLGAIDRADYWDQLLALRDFSVLHDTLVAKINDIDKRLAAHNPQLAAVFITSHNFAVTEGIFSAMHGHHNYRWGGGLKWLIAADEQFKRMAGLGFAVFLDHESSLLAHARSVIRSAGTSTLKPYQVEDEYHTLVQIRLSLRDTFARYEAPAAVLQRAPSAQLKLGK